MTIRTEAFDFQGRSGQLSGRLETPIGIPIRAHALFAHCFTCGKEAVAASRISRALAEHGIATLRFDFAGLGASQGEFEDTHFSSNVDDLVAAADALRSRATAPALLVGHSLGGTAVLAAAARIAEVRAVATIGAPAEPRHVRRLLAAGESEIEASGEALIQLAGRPFRIRRALLDDLEAQHVEQDLARLRVAILVMHAPRDPVVGIENASRIFEAARHPKSFVSLDGADHLLTKREDAAYAASTIAAWAARYLPEPAAPPALAEPGEVVVGESGEGRFHQTIAVGRHRLEADEPAALGGDDAGPTPYGLLLASLGACTAMTIRIVAERKRLPLAGVTVRLRHDKVHASDCAECETRVGKIDHIERTLELDGALDDAARAELLAVADRCPVHRTLHAEVHVVTRLAAAESGT